MAVRTSKTSVHSTQCTTVSSRPTPPPDARQRRGSIGNRYPQPVWLCSVAQLQRVSKHFHGLVFTSVPHFFILSFFEFSLLGWQGLMTFHRLHAYNAMICHLSVALCAHHPTSRLLPSLRAGSLYPLPHPTPAPW